MKNKIFTIIFFLLTAIVTGPLFAQNAQNLFSFKKGKTFDYTCRIDGQNETFNMAVKMQSVRKGRQTVRFSAPFYGQTDRCEILIETPTGIQLAGIIQGEKQEDAFEPPVIIIPNTVHQGHTWHWQGRTPWGNANAHFQVLGNETVKTQNKSYECVKILSQWNFNDGVKQKLERWYAKDVGMVKEVMRQTQANETVTITSVLRELQ